MAKIILILLMTVSCHASWFFDGAGDWCNLGIHSQLNIATATASGLTVDLWINERDFGIEDYDIIIGRCNDGYNAGYEISIYDGRPRIEIYSQAPLAFFGISGNQVLKINTWYHLYFVVTMSTAQVYVNGILQDSNYIVGTPHLPDSTASKVYMGRNVAAATQYFNGYIDEVRIWNKALTLREIQSRMWRKIGSEPGLAGLWHMDGATTMPVEYTKRLKPVSNSGNARWSPKNAPISNW